MLVVEMLTQKIAKPVAHARTPLYTMALPLLAGKRVTRPKGTRTNEQEIVRKIRIHS